MKHPKVNSINVSEVRELLKDCPKLVVDYINALERALEGQKRVTNKAIQKINELTELTK